MRAAIYARKSTEQIVADEAKSITRQVEHAQAFAEKNGWTMDPAHVYTDDAISGASFDRPGLTRLLEAVRSRPRPIDVIVMMSVDRLGREMSETMRLSTQIVRAGVRVFFYQSGTELLLNTPTEKLKATIDTFTAEAYRADIQKKVRDVMRGKAEKGHSTGGHVLGYTRREVMGANGQRSHVERVVDERQAQIVRRIFQMAGDGLGFARIAKALNREGVRNPTGWIAKVANPSRKKPSHLWAATGIRQVLRRKLYIGIMEYCQSRLAEPVQDEHGHERQLKVLRPASEWVRTKVPALRIVNDELWQAAQDRIERTRSAYLRQRDGRLLGKPESGLASKTLLAGFVRCGVCGGNLARVNRDGRPIFVCSLHHRRGTSGCPGKYTASVDSLTRAVVERLRGILASPASMAGMLAEAEALCKAPDDLDAQAQALTGQVAKLDGELDRLAEAVATGGAIPALVGRLKDTQRQRDEAAKGLAHLEGLGRGPGFDRADWEAFLQLLVCQLDQVFKLEPQVGRQVLRKILGDRAITVKIGPAGVFSLSGHADLGAAADYLLAEQPFTGERSPRRL